MNTVKQAFEFASKAHAGQTRKDGKTPYILHPVAVSMNVIDTYIVGCGESELTFMDKCMIVALLHDVIEDCGVTVEELIAEFGAWIADPMIHVSSVTKGDSRPRQVRKQVDEDHYANGCEIAQTVKVADMLHNISDMGNNPDADLKYQLMYLNEKKRLINRLTRVNSSFKIHVEGEIDRKIQYIEEVMNDER